MNIESIQNGSLLVLAGMAVTVGFYLWYRFYYSGRVILILFNQKRELKRRSAKPTSRGELTIPEGTYMLEEAKVFHTKAHFFREMTPSLIYQENNPHQIDIFSITNTAAYSAQELSRIMNDKTVEDYVNATRGVNPKQLMYTTLAIGGVILLVLVVFGYYGFQFIQNEAAG